MKVQVVSRKLIKPLTPTPSHLKTYKISLIDELIPPLNLGIPLFYASKPDRISDLEESLSKTLVEFYPLAGRYINKDHTIDCSDQGVEFVLARAPDLELKDLITQRDVKKLNQDFLSLPIYQDDEEAAPLASFQMTELKCGGVVVGISISHKLFDTSSVNTFIHAWSDVNQSGASEAVSPNFYSPSLFPCDDQIPEEELRYDPDVVVKSFVFDKAAITKLRSKLFSRSTTRPISRVRVVSALISMAMIRADRAKYGKSRPCVISQPVNMRERTIPPLPKDSCGNLVVVSSTRCIETDDIGIQQLVDSIGDAVEKSVADCAEIFMPGRDRSKIINESLNDFVEKLQSGEVNVMWFSDWSRFGFYEADLGWGKPVRYSFGPFAAEKMTVLLGNEEGGGVEALVHLKHHDMAVFEQDEEIKLFAS